MDLASAFYRLWTRKLWLIPVLLIAGFVAFNVAYRVSLLPPDVKSRYLEYGVADTSLLVDSDRSSVATAELPLNILGERASIYAELLRSDSVRREIGRQAGVPWETVLVDGVSTASGGAAGPEPTGTERAAGLASEARGRQIFFRVLPQQPIIHISTQGRTAAEAAALAQASARALEKYLEKLQRSQGIAGPQRIALTQIGQPVGSFVNQSADLQLAVLAGLATFAFGCLLVLFVPRAIAAIRVAERRDHERNLEPVSDETMPPDHADAEDARGWTDAPETPRERPWPPDATPASGNGSDGEEPDSVPPRAPFLSRWRRQGSSDPDVTEQTRDS
jgi:hypothetical protein